MVTDTIMTRLRSLANAGDAACIAGTPMVPVHKHTVREAADEIERLKEALRTMVYETTHLSPMETDGSHWCKISAEALAQARATLSKTEAKHDL